LITLVDYGLGNLKAFKNIYRSLNVPVCIASTAAELKSATKLILPGVGAFDWAMTKLNESGMRGQLDTLVCEKAVPVLGVCVGMQMLANGSEEGKLDGLGWLDADVVKFKKVDGSAGVSLPQMGWNSISIQRESPLFVDLAEGAEFYFLHSYYFLSKDSGDALSISHYGNDFVSAVNSRNIYGTQFHPEKSHSWGIQLLKNFAELDG